MERIYWISVPGSLLLQVLIISALIRGSSLKRYPFLLVLIVSELLNTVVNLASIMDVHQWTKETALYYWVGEGVTFGALFLTQVHMLYRSMDDGGRAGRLSYLILLTVLFAAFATWQAYDPKFNRWMTQIARNFSFGSIFVNLTLWTVLLRRMDQQRLLITAAFGMQLAGEAIGHSMRQMSRSLVTAGNLILVCTYLLRLYLIWRAFSPTLVVARNQVTSGSDDERLRAAQTHACSGEEGDPGDQRVMRLKA